MVQAKAVDLRKTSSNQIRGQVSNIDENPVTACLPHLIEDASSYCITRGKLSLMSIIRHEAVTFYIA
jgi:hypothetical protein